MRVLRSIWLGVLASRTAAAYRPQLPLYHTATSQNSVDAFNWSSIEPSQDLIYHDCYDDFKCARLSVPLDWTNSSNENEVAVAIVKLPAKVPVTSPSFAGSIIVNPGGPGGSGTDDLRYKGLTIQNIVDGDKHFEIISFDPRGVHRTTPSPVCFETNEARELFEEANKFAGGADVKSSLDVKWALAQGFGYVCRNASYGIYPNGDDIKQFVSTALVAHDMVRLIDAIEGERAEFSSFPVSNGQRPMERSSPSTPLLNYWGFSYGTYLGNTFASMFPHRIGRMILDGNVDADDYATTGWSTNLQDNNLVWRKFFEWCFEAESECALFDRQAESSLALHAKTIDLFEKVKSDPVSYVDAQGRVKVLTYFNLE
jgi:pimeloyl-ACP methyl ester carboxylesterase